MLVHLSNISPYVCDLNRGPIEEANRMASAPTKKATALLEHKESFPKVSRTPLKLLAPDEVPMDTTATTTDRNASLQPVWYTEQTIVDDHPPTQQEDIASIIQEQQQREKSLRSHTTLPPIQSESPSITEEEQIPSQPLLMHKSSTFTIESSINIDSPLNDSEKENAIKEDTTNQIIPPSDDSFRTLEQLLGLGSPTTVRESIKTNHDTLSLTVVTPTDIINSTSTSLRMSFAPKTGTDSLPSSQEIPIMPTIESINSTNPPSFLMENTTMEEEQPVMPSINAQTSFDITENDTIKDDTNNDDETNFSLELNDFKNTSNNESTNNIPEPIPAPMITIRAPTCADVAYRALIKPRAGGRISQPVKADSPLAKTNKLRSSAPTSRMLRSSCRRISTDAAAENPTTEEQPATTTECFVNETERQTTEFVEIVSVPEEDENEHEKTTSVTLNLISTKPTEEINQNSTMETEEYSTPTKPMLPILSQEYTYNTPKRRASERRRSMLNGSSATPIQQQPQQTTIHEEESNSPTIASKSMLNILLTQQTEGEQSVLQKTLPTEVTPKSVRGSKRKTMNEEITTASPSIASKSMLNILLTQPTEAEPSVSEKTITTPTSVRSSRRTTTASPSIASKSMLGILLTQPTEAQPSVSQETLTTPTSARASTQTTINEEATSSPTIASKSMLGILLTQPTEAEPSVVPSPVRTPTSTTRKSDRLSTNPTPRASINPLHSSTPSTTRHKSLQMVSIGEQEQVSTIVPQQINIEIQREEIEEQIEMIPLNDTEQSLQDSSSFRTTEIGIQTTPSLDTSSRRRLNAQTTPIVQINKSSSIVIVNGEQQTQHQPQNLTPLQTKLIMNLQRNVRFQLTPSTDARLAAKEKLEENLRGLKPDIVIIPTPVLPPPKKETVKKVKAAPVKRLAKPKKKLITPKKKKVTTPKKPVSKKQTIQKKSPQPRKVPQKQKPIPPPKEAKKKAEVVPPTKESKKKAKVVPPTPTKRAPKKRSTVEVSPPTKRTSRKRTIPETTVTPTEPITKRSKISKKPIEVKKQPVEAALPPLPPKAQNASVKNKKPVPEPTIQEQPKARRGSRTNIKAVPQLIKQEEPKARRGSRSNSKTIPEPVKQEQPKARKGSMNNKKIVAEPIPRQIRTRSNSVNNTKPVVEPKITTSATKTRKRQAQSVDKNEALKKKVEEEKVQSIPPVQNVELSQEERKKIEALTVAGLKTRLNKHKADIPKSAKKADLVALLIQIETNLEKKNEKPAEAATVDTKAKTTRRRKK